MPNEQATTFAFAGDAKVGENILSLLSAAGFAPEAPEAADVVFTYATTVSALEDLYYDAQGLLQTTCEGAVLVDLSPATPTFAHELNAVAQVNNRQSVDAPLSVRDMTAEHAFGDPANLAICAGGPSESYRYVEPMLRAIAARVVYAGAAGHGQSVKAAASLATAAALVGLVEAQALFPMEQNAAAPDDLLDFLIAAGSLTPAQETLVEAMQDERFEGDFTLENLMAEAAAALAAVEDGDNVLPQAEAGFRLMELLAMVGGIDLNPAALKLVFASEEAAQEYGLDWSRAEGAYEGGCDCDDDECDCGHDHGEDHDCDCGHDHR